MLGKVKYVQVNDDHPFFIILSKNDYMRVNNAQTKLTLSYNVRVASCMFVGDALERDVMCNVLA